MDFQILIDRFKAGTDKLRNKQCDLYKDIVKDADADIVSSIALAHTDMARRAQGHSEEIKEKSIKILVERFERFICNSPFSILKEEFDEWHQETCKKYCDELNKQFGRKFKMTCGRAQKVLNMTFKYLYCTKKYGQEVEKLIDVLHMTLDGYTLRWYKDSIVPKLKLKKGDVSEWSKMNETGKHQYIDIQNRIREYLKDKVDYKYVINTEDVNEDNDDVSDKKQVKDIASESIALPTSPFKAEFIVWEGEIVRAKMEALFKGLNGCYKSWNEDKWALGKDIEDELKNKMDKIYLCF